MSGMTMLPYAPACLRVPEIDLTFLGLGGRPTVPGTLAVVDAGVTELVVVVGGLLALVRVVGLAGFIWRVVAES